MQTITITQVQEKLLPLLKDGKDILVLKGKTPVAKITSLIREKKTFRKLGLWKDKVWVSRDFDDENEKIKSLFYGEK